MYLCMEPNTANKGGSYVKCQIAYCIDASRRINVDDEIKKGTITLNGNSSCFVIHNFYMLSIKCTIFYDIFMCDRYHIVGICNICRMCIIDDLHGHMISCVHGFKNVYERIGMARGKIICVYIDDIFQRTGIFCYLNVDIENLVNEHDDADIDLNKMSRGDKNQSVIYSGAPYFDLLIDRLASRQARCVICNMYYDSFPTKEIMYDHMNSHIKEKMDFRLVV